MALLSLHNVTKQFGGLTAVDNCSFSVNENSVVSLIGPNGAGKTTVFNLISGISSVTSGSISLKGRELVGLKSYQVAQLGIGRTFQNTRLFSEVTVLENVKIGSHCRSTAGLLGSLFRTSQQRNEERSINERAGDLLNFVGLFHRRQDLATSLSYGDQKRLEIARAMMIEPCLVMLDEPNSGMNDNETFQLVELIKQIREKGITVVIISHHMKFVQGISDMVIVLNYGKVIANGKPEEVVSKKEVVESYLGKVH